MTAPTQSSPKFMRIGVFDSGFGGLTVLRSLLSQIPTAEYFYLGDTARLPYGSKSRATVARYAVESARLLESYGAQYLVIACNTASALALDAIRAVAKVPVLGVIETGADSASVSSATRDVLVLATDATVQSHAYAQACTDRGLRAIEVPCPLLVPLIEEGWTDNGATGSTTGDITRQVLRVYLDQAMAEAKARAYNLDTILLGCTHYPLLRPTLEATVSGKMTILDSAETTARRVRQQLQTKDRNDSGGIPDPRCHFFATDSVEKFRTLGSRFLGQPIDKVELVDRGG